MSDGKRSGTLKDLARLLLGHSARFRQRELQEIAARSLRAADGERVWTVSLLNASLWIRRAARIALLRARRTRSQRAFRRLPASRYTGPQRTMTLLCPTRGRTAQVVRMLSSIQDTAAVPGRVEVLFYVDSDDASLEEYRTLFAGIGKRFGALGRCEMLVGEPIGVPAAWNELAAAARGDLLMMANDDQLYVDFGWDVVLDARVAELTAERPDEVLCLFFDGGQYPEGAHDFPILTRVWYETVGYFTPTMFSQWEVETWVFDIAERLDRLYSVPGVLVEHLHYQDYKAPFDETYQRHRMTTQKAYADHALFLRTTGQRVADAAKLQAVIDAAGGAGSSASSTSSASSAGLPAVADSSGSATLDAEEFWFTAYLAEQLDRVGTELEGLTFGGLTFEDGSVLLVDDGQWTPWALASAPVTMDVLAAIPEATLPAGSTVRMSVLTPGESRDLPSVAAPDALTVCWGVRVPDGARLGVGSGLEALPAGRCVVFEGGQTLLAVNDGADGADGAGGAEPFVIVHFAVERPAALVPSTGARPGTVVGGDV